MEEESWALPRRLPGPAHWVEGALEAMGPSSHAVHSAGRGKIPVPALRPPVEPGRPAMPGLPPSCQFGHG